MSFGFGGLPPAQMSPDDLARLFSRAPLGAPQGFSGSTGVTIAPEPSTVPLPPERPSGLMSEAVAAPAKPAADPRADMPAPGAVPAIAPVAPSPAPAQAPAPSTSADDGFMGGLRRFRDNGGFDYLGALGAGLLSSPTMAGGVAAGMQLAQRGETQRAAGDLARTELALKKNKLAQEAGALQGNAQIVKRAFPNLSDAEAVSAGSNSSLVTEALKIIRDPNHGRDSDPGVIRARAQAQAEGTAAGQPQDVYRQEADDAGNVWSVNGRTGQRTVALQAKQDKTFRSLTDPSERAKFGIDPSDKRTAQIGADGHLTFPGAGGQNITIGGPEKEQDKTLGKGYGDYQLDLATKGRNAGSTLNTLALMEQAMKTPGFYSGVGGEGVKRANQFLGALGVKDAKAASAAEVFDALSNKVVLDGLGGSLGPGISNTDRDYISRTAPTLAQSEQGNRDLIGVARALAQRQQAVSKLARDYAGKNGGRLDAGFDQALDEFAASNPLFPQARQGASASAPQEPPQGSPNGARRAPDGNWYVADPNRPGKFMRVQ